MRIPVRVKTHLTDVIRLLQVGIVPCCSKRISSRGYLGTAFPEKLGFVIDLACVHF